MSERRSPQTGLLVQERYDPAAALKRAREASRMIDRAQAAGHRGGHRPSVGPLRAVPDHELITTLVVHGMPLVSANTVSYNGQFRFTALQFWSDVEHAGRGDKEAKARVDYCRQLWDQYRRQNLISDDPRRHQAAA